MDARGPAPELSLETLDSIVFISYHSTFCLSSCGRGVCCVAPPGGILIALSCIIGSRPRLRARRAPLRACWTSCRTRAPALAYWHPLPPCGPAGRVVARGLRPLPTGTLCPPVGLFCECRGCCKRVTANGAWILPESVLGLTRCSLPMGVSVGVGRVHGDRRGAMSENSG